MTAARRPGIKLHPYLACIEQSTINRLARRWQELPDDLRAEMTVEAHRMGWEPEWLIAGAVLDNWAKDADR